MENETNQLSFLGLHKKKIVLIVGVALTVVLLVLLALFGSTMIRKGKLQDETKTVNSPSAIKKTVYGAVLPPGYPAQIPIVSGAKLLQSYSKEYPTKMYQTSTLYSSDKDMNKNVLLYKNFMTQDGWKITGSSTHEKMTSLQAVKGEQILEVIVRKKPEGGQNMSTSTPRDNTILSYIIINVFRK